MYCAVRDKMCDVQAHSIQFAGSVLLESNLLKPIRLEFPAQNLATQLPLPVVHSGSSPPDWLEYVFRTSHPVLSWLPTKLAEWIGENLQEVLGSPDKGDARASPGSGWTAAELNHILQAHVVFPLFLAGNSTPTIPHSFSKFRIRFPCGLCRLSCCRWQAWEQHV